MRNYSICYFILMVLLSCNNVKKIDYMYVEVEKAYNYINQVNRLDDTLKNRFLTIKKQIAIPLIEEDTIHQEKIKDNYLKDKLYSDTVHRFYIMEFFEKKDDIDSLLFKMNVKFVLCLLKNNIKPVWVIKSVNHKAKYLNQFDYKIQQLQNTIVVRKEKIVSLTTLKVTFQSKLNPGIYWDAGIHLALYSKSQTLKDTEIILHDILIDEKKSDFIVFIQRGLCNTKNKIILKIHQDSRTRTSLPPEDLPNIEYKYKIH